MITRAAVVPQPPLLVPELVPGAVERTASVRDACVAAVKRLPPRWVAVGATAQACPIPSSACGTFRGFGVDVRVALAGDADGEPVDLPLPALLAGWLREQAGAESVEVELLTPSAGPEECAAVGGRLAALDGDVGLLVLGDGSNRHGAAAPGGDDARAPGFDAEVGAALAAADAGALLDIAPGLAAELGVQGRVPWQVLAGLARAGSWRGELLYSEAPLGVAYHVAVWERS
ncbi:hypothetical protein DI005_13350 [Prauserella sp. PE36]|uniref:class III extradiol dioxygenase subunit B-like domain-containing protein n=1 Tax=Prauserella sp. PE36 TaxID=1504709 RepID=UPI000D8DC1CF|nr:class III extradiol dioxygenase subunit B-like domain-containing protein [Prauserella sp. PE36]PXY24986.1 hypothetical protein BAY59_23400 [Prauserella coralliicola]RBM20341.1 hypothetical protein DI005_13350 [Prauserella sp. PE36]